MTADGTDRSGASAAPSERVVASGADTPNSHSASQASRTSAAVAAVVPPLPANPASAARPGGVPTASSAKVRPKPKPKPKPRRKPRRKQKLLRRRPPEDRPLEAGVQAVQVLWSQASLLITLIGLLSYGLGRLMVDGFYGELHTTAEAAGLGYTSILEPTALVTAIVAIAGTALAAISDALLAAARWLIEYRHIIFLILGLVALAAGLAYVLAFARIEELLAFLSSASVVAFKTLLSRVQGVFGRFAGGKAAAPPTAAARSVGFRPTPSTKLQRVTSVALSLAVLAGLFFTAHEFGIREGKQAVSGKSVSITLLGFTIDSVTATVVRIQPATPGAAMDQLAKARCLLQVGPGSSALVLYNPANKVTTTVPADQLLVSNAGETCPK